MIMCPDYHGNLCPSCARVMHFSSAFHFFFLLLNFFPHEIDAINKVKLRILHLESIEVLLESPEVSFGSLNLNGLKKDLLRWPVAAMTWHLLST